MNLDKVGVKLAYLLRHCQKPLYVDLQGGWADVEQIIAALGRKIPGMNRATLDAVVASDNKGRFSYDETGTRIRANQGHSIPGVQVEMQSATPPEYLYHGTSDRFLASIMSEGLLPMNRQFVHLSRDVATAVTVGKRHGGKTVVLRVAAGAMAQQGIDFWLSANNVWQVKQVASDWLSVLSDWEEAK